MKILFFGDIVGKIGRQAIKKVLPELKQELQPDLVLANAENLAHGKGVTKKTLDEMLEAGIQAFTSGNHITKKGEYGEILEDPNYPIIRPANYPPGVPGKEYLKLEINGHAVYVLNFLGRVFFQETVDCPFRKFDELKELLRFEENDIIIVDLHAEATSEKIAFGWHVDGKVSCLLGTHTHVAAADEKILPRGTGYISDVGMTGPVDSVLGVKKEIILDTFLTQVGTAHELPESGEVEVNAVLVNINEETGRCEKIERVKRMVMCD